jgi:acyl carrier protein
MNIQQIQSSIIDFIKEKSHSDEINLDDNLLTIIKSYDFMMLIIKLEDTFRLTLPLDQAIANDVNTINQFIVWVEQYEQNK